ncbi:MAG: hypothetical protein R3E55_14985 [Burkholderiaceae bacterium]
MGSIDLTIEDLEKRLLADPAQVDGLLRHFDPTMRALLSTSNNLYLEYATPKGNSLLYDTVPMIFKIIDDEVPVKHKNTAFVCLFLSIILAINNKIEYIFIVMACNLLDFCKLLG